MSVWLVMQHSSEGDELLGVCEDEEKARAFGRSWLNGFDPEGSRGLYAEQLYVVPIEFGEDLESEPLQERATWRGIDG